MPRFSSLTQNANARDFQKKMDIFCGNASSIMTSFGSTVLEAHAVARKVQIHCHIVSFSTMIPHPHLLHQQQDATNSISSGGGGGYGDLEAINARMNFLALQMKHVSRYNKDRLVDLTKHH